MTGSKAALMARWMFGRARKLVRNVTLLAPAACSISYTLR